MRPNRLAKCAAMSMVGLLVLNVACDSHRQKVAHTNTLQFKRIPEDTLACANRYDFDYSGEFARARHNDMKALTDLLQFTLTTDGGSALGHGMVLDFLIQELGDEVFSRALVSQDRNLKHSILILLEAGLSGPNVP